MDNYVSPNFCGSGNIVAVSTGSGEIHFVDVDAGVNGKWQRAIARGHDGAVKSVAWQRDGTHLVSGGSDSTIILWRLEKVSQK